MSAPRTTTLAEPLQAALHTGRLLVRLASLFSFSAGALLLAQPILRHVRFSGRLEYVILPPNFENIADFAELISGLFLVFLAYELLQRRRTAWYLALGVSVASMVSQLYLATPAVHMFFLFFVTATLLAGRRQFIVGTHVAHLKQGVRALVLSLLGAMLYGTLGFWLLDKRDFGVTFSFASAAEHTLQQYVLLGSGDLTPRTHYGHWFLISLTIVGVSTLIYCLYNILRPLAYELQTAPTERARAREILEKYGGGIDDYFKLWPQDKSYFFSHDDEAFIAYGVAHGVAVCFADPEGKPESIPGLLDDFQRYCYGNGWLIAFIATSDKHAELYAHRQFERVLIGADAVIILDKFLQETRRNKYFRNILNRFQKGNFTATRYLPPHSPELINELRNVSNDWLKIPGHKQWRFLTGYFSNRYFRETPLFVVRDEIGKALAFANEIPSFKKGQATIDLMRHRRNAPKNVMDFLFASLMQQLSQEGYKEFNLGLSPMARQSFAGKPSERLLDYIYLASQRFISMKGLHQYKSKFDPEWEPRYVHYVGGSPSLPQIGLALAKLTKYN